MNTNKCYVKMLSILGVVYAVLIVPVIVTVKTLRAWLHDDYDCRRFNCKHRVPRNLVLAGLVGRKV